MTYLFLHLIVHCYIHLLLLLFLSPDQLIFCHMITSYINSLIFLFIFCFSLTKGQRSKHQTLLLSVSAVHQPFYISICIVSLLCLRSTLRDYVNQQHCYSTYLTPMSMATRTYLLREPIQSEYMQFCAQSRVLVNLNMSYVYGIFTYADTAGNICAAGKIRFPYLHDSILYVEGVYIDRMCYLWL